MFIRNPKDINEQNKLFSSDVSISTHSPEKQQTFPPCRKSNEHVEGNHKNRKADKISHQLSSCA